MSQIIFINQQFPVSSVTPEIQWQMIGGGAGQYYANGSGGGGAGALVTRTSIGEKVYTGRTVTIVIGSGTLGGYNGQSTTLSIPAPTGIDIYGNVSGTWGTITRTAYGGGYGSTVYPTTASAGAEGGGSAGGGSGSDYRLIDRKLSANSGDIVVNGANLNFQRHWGGTAYYNYYNPRGAGGGGAGGNGQDATSTRGGDGGVGVNSWYAGYLGAGGGGGSPGAYANQGLNPPFYSLGPGAANTGSGGGSFGQNGGSGVVQIRYPNTYNDPASHTATTSGDDGTYKFFVFNTSGSITF